MRPGQHNKRGRNRHRSGGTSGGGGGGNPLSRVYESNGPDVKVRGTAQTVAEKYLQLGRDAQSAGDNVMAESYYQHAEHYLRIVAAAQAYQQQMQQQFRRPGEDFDDEDGDEMPDGASVEQRGGPIASGEQPDIAGDQPFEPEREPQPQQQPYRQRESRDRDMQSREPRDTNGNRDYRDRDQGQPREARDQSVARDQLPPQFGGPRERDRGRPRWQDRRDPAAAQEPRQPAASPRNEEQPAADSGNDAGNSQWEAPSFLRRPAPLPAAEPTEPAAQSESPAASAPPAAERRPRGRPRRERPAEAAAEGPATAQPSPENAE